MRHSCLEDLLVLLDELLAQLDEVGPADRDLPLGVRLLRRREVRVVGQRRVAADAVVVLDPALGRQAVVVPAHRVEDRLAAHPLVAGDQVGVGVGEDVPDVQAAAHGRRRGVDRVDVLARLGAVEGVGVVGLPALAPTCPRAPRAQACPVRRRRGLSALVVVRWPGPAWVSVMPEILGRSGPPAKPVVRARTEYLRFRGHGREPVTEDR